MTKTELGHQWDRFKQKEDRLKTFSCLSKHLSNRMTEIENTKESINIQNKIEE